MDKKITKEKENINSFNASCPKCGETDIDNFNMVIILITEQPLKFYRNLPSKLSLFHKKSQIGTWCIWDSPHLIINCRNCGYTIRPYDENKKELLNFKSFFKKIN